MNWDAIGAIAEALGALGVIATLLYLGRQLNLSSKAQRTATQHDILAEFRGGISQLIGDDELLRTFQKFSEGEEPDRESRYKLALFIGNQFRIYEELYLAFLDGNVSADMWESRCETIRDRYLRHSLTQRWWKTTGSTIYSSPFVSLVEGLLLQLDGDST